MRCRLPNPLVPRVCLPLALLLVVVMLFVAACAGTTRDRVMHFFFEYPDPGASSKPLESVDKVTARDIAMGGAAAPFAMSRHRPFVEHRCKVCHNPQRQFAPRLDMPAHCQSCHPKYFENKPYAHAPVLAKACIVCHTMHASRHRRLLRASQATLCTKCHDAQFEAASLETYHRGIDGVDCTACHNPHGSALRMLLKPESERLRVSTGSASTVESRSSTVN